MLDTCCVFTKGGALLWALSLAPFSSSSEAVSALVRGCLLEERAADAEWTYHPSAPGGAATTLKWTMDNGLGLVFVAAYSAALRLPHVDELLRRVKAAFAPLYRPGVYDYAAAFDPIYAKIAAQTEARAIGKAGAAAPADARPTSPTPGRGGAAKGGARGGAAKGASAGADADGQGADDDEDDDADADAAAPTAADPGFDVSQLARRAGRRAAGGAGGRAGGRAGGAAGGGGGRAAKKGGKRVKQARVWGDAPLTGEEAEALDFTEDKPPEGGAAGAAGGEDAGPDDLSAPSLLDVQQPEAEEEDEGDEEDEAFDDDEGARRPSAGRRGAARGGGATAAPSARSAGVLSSFARSLATRVGGTAALTEADVSPALDELKRRLVERNVAEEIAQRVSDSVKASLVGRPVKALSGGVTGAVRRAVEAALTRVLTPRASVDVLAAARAARSRGPDEPPYTIVFVGVNGVGKSTNLAKVAYWLGQHGLRVMLAACDTFRSGAVEQLQTHAKRLGVPLFQRGYERDPAKVAAEAQRAARAQGCDCVLVDTAGRMQDNEPLMRALAGLVRSVEPDLVLFVGEALAGNDAVDQLSAFSRRLSELLPPPRSRAPIDGILLTKFDTVSEKVGAALSLVYTSGAPIMFVGCGQTYVDLRRLDVKSVVKPLLA